MPSILSEDEKLVVKRTVPKASNKIQAVAVAKLYIAYPNRARWTDTGLQGAAVLANDTVGNTFWVKLVDVSHASRGVLWDQEIYDSFAYNQDRTFFHTFEGEDCLFGLSFADEKEAKQFRKKMDEREKNAHKNTVKQPFAHGPGGGGAGGGQQTATVGGGGKHSRFGGLFGHRSNAGNQPAPQSIIPPRGVDINHSSSPAQASRPQSSAGAAGIDLSDPAVQAVLKDLQSMGITEDQIEEHAGFIKSYLEQHKATAAAEAERNQRAARAPPPAPPGAQLDLSPQDTGGSGGAAKRGPPPAPPPSRRTGGDSPAVQQRPRSPSPSPLRATSPPRPKFRAPPPIADAGKFANDPATARGRASSVSQPGPPPPPRPPKTPLDNDSAGDAPQQTRFGVPPPFTGARVPSGPPAPPPRNSGGVPPPPPPRSNDGPPPPPPRITSGGGGDAGPPPPPPLPPSSSRPVPPPPSAGAPSSGPPPPPPLPPPSSSAGPPPPPMPPRNSAAAPPPPALPSGGGGGRDGLLADIRGGARLKKVSDAEKRDRSGAMVPGSESAAPPPPPPGGSGASGGGDAQAGGLAGALASALAARKSKVSHSDDEGDDEDW